MVHMGRMDSIRMPEHPTTTFAVPLSRSPSSGRRTHLYHRSAGNFREELVRAVCDAHHGRALDRAWLKHEEIRAVDGWCSAWVQRLPLGAEKIDSFNVVSETGIEVNVSNRMIVPSPKRRRFHPSG